MEWQRWDEMIREGKKEARRLVEPEDPNLEVATVAKGAQILNSTSMQYEDDFLSRT